MQIYILTLFSLTYIMETKFAVIIQKHRLIGWVLAPFEIVRHKDKEFFEAVEYLLPESNTKYTQAFEKKIISLIARYDEKQLFTKFAKRKKDIQPEEEFVNQNLMGDMEGQLTIDVYQTDDEIIVESAIAGVDPKDIDIDATSESVTIRGERKKSNEISDQDYFYQECFWGRFSRSVILPQEVDPDKASSVLKNGVLKVHLPKIHKDVARKISVDKE